MSKYGDMDFDPAEPLWRADAVANGYTDREIRRLYTGRGECRLRRGVSVAADVFDSLSAIDKHRLLVTSAIPAMSPDAVVSHQSAAALYRARDLRLPLRAVHFTRNRRNGGRRTKVLEVHCAPLDEVVMLDGLLVTPPARTIVDVARTVPATPALVAADSIARSYGVTAAELATELQKAKRRRGIAAAERVVGMLDPRSESAGETCSRIMFRRLALPNLRTQGIVTDKRGRFLGRVDFYTDDGFVGEFDGEVKYGRSLRSGKDPGQAVFEEKVREDRLRDSGSRVARWIWRELDGADAGRRIREALDRDITFEGRIVQAVMPKPLSLTFTPPPGA